MRRRWRWIGHVTRQETSIAKTALHFTGRQKGNSRGAPQDHVATDSGERNQGDGEDLGRHQVHGKGSPDV